MKVKLVDLNKVVEVDHNITVFDIYSTYGKELLPDALLSLINGELKDLSAKPDEGDTISLVYAGKEALEPLRHSVSHIMAQAVRRLFPESQYTIGPAIEDGFYYDFHLPRPLAPEDLPVISEEMDKIVKENLVIVAEKVSKDEAMNLFASLGQNYKVELIAEIEDEWVTLYRQGEYVDLCRGPHMPSTGKSGSFQLISIAGAYFKGDEKRPMLQRIYGTAFFTREELDGFLKQREEALKRDHRKLGKELEFFSIEDEIGAGLVLWHPKGAMIRKIIEDFWRDEHLKRGYGFVFSPHIGRESLWQTSGHLSFYSEYMYSPMEVDEQKYLIKPMNCPFAMVAYKSKTRSYKDLPLRWAELGTVYRNERSGVLHGLLRVRGFTQDDAHIFCRPDQLKDEIKNAIELAQYILETFGFHEYSIEFSVRDLENKSKYVGEEKAWEMAGEAIEQSMKELGLNYKVIEGEAKFYGPAIDIKIKDAIGRLWQCTTIQVDFNLPQRFNIIYMGPDGKEYQPVMVHRAILGSFERFFGTLIEHYSGAFPLWLSPVQVKILPVKPDISEYAENISRELKKNKIRVEVDNREEALSAKIKTAQHEQVPYMLILGKREQEVNLIAVRERRKGDLGAMDLLKFIELVKEELPSFLKE
ncbi:MAG: Threonine--tRNA ligase 1 [candidate division WS2 bacterium]|uniref:Threonine--tRNA ligase n=1 Tax=Psychracetigena formicireducens TaxID=2986056 RepID=A0A9E2BI71_PSYF1|nr:Threonine--tRNA ligase 1 [Candidatus Psychracetigena formicireducens]MBT9145519.1 Threonine--tRNA ligase 1 [Candidatus Psychracetigena formicireducens]